MWYERKHFFYYFLLKNRNTVQIRCLNLSSAAAADAYGDNDDNEW